MDSDHLARLHACYAEGSSSGVPSKARILVCCASGGTLPAPYSRRAGLPHPYLHSLMHACRSGSRACRRALWNAAACHSRCCDADATLAVQLVPPAEVETGLPDVLITCCQASMQRGAAQPWRCMRAFFGAARRLPHASHRQSCARPAVCMAKFCLPACCIVPSHPVWCTTCYQPKMPCSGSHSAQAPGYLLAAGQTPERNR